jgi:hypothetical protein
LNAWAHHWGLPQSAIWRITIEEPLDRALLGEPRPTQLDALVENDDILITFECKFTERQGGSCSQTAPIKKPSVHAGHVQCTGSYVMQTNPVNGREARCALVPKGVKYWEYVPRVLSIESDVDRRPCPFKGGWFQWMRNMVAAAALADSRRKRGATVLIHAGANLPMEAYFKSVDWEAFTALPKAAAIPLLVATYDELLKIGATAAIPKDAETLNHLRGWIQRKIDQVTRANR